jgi:hypothetical protein
MGCNQTIKNNDFEADNNIYTAKHNFGQVENQILKCKLDSILNAIPYWRLDNYKTINHLEGYAVEFLKKDLKDRGYQVDEFVIYEVKIDSNFSYHMNHIDYYVYEYNREKKDLPPITGNVTGQEGLYIVDLEKRTVKIIYGQ